MLMIRIVFFSLFAFVVSQVNGQFTDDFSDNNFSQNPQWIGTSLKFTVNDQVLALNDNQAGAAWLVTQSTRIEQTQWEFWIRMAFTPSNNNHPKIYLVSDNPDLSAPLNGYYIRIGKDGTGNKKLYFFRQEEETHTEIMAGSDNLASTSNNRIRIKVIRDGNGNWSFFADQDGGRLYLPQGSVNDRSIAGTQWFGIHCSYTVSNSKNFYFDDFYVGDIIVDNTPPSVTTIIPLNENALLINFSEPVEPVAATTITNFVVDKEIGPPVSAKFSGPEKIILTFENSFIQKENYTIQINHVTDYAGNSMGRYTGHFIWFQPSTHDVVFNEIMANPSPAVGLPAHEYIELYNRTDYEINISGWILMAGSAQRLLPPALIPAKGYLILTHGGGFDDLKNYGNIIAVGGMTSTTLTNAGLTLVLYNQNMEMMTYVVYSDQWYANPSKTGGGWSLERIDPENVCEGSNNWKASVDPKGGTPGARNSVFTSNPDVTAPSLLRAGFEASNEVSLYFSENMPDESIIDVGLYALDRGIGNPVEVVTYPPVNRKVSLILEQDLQPGVIYQVTLSPNISDCAGNRITKRTSATAIPFAAEDLDLVINEILFNPPEGGVRYVEIYNRSSRVLDM
jgi:hypothetical protein